ncbi:MAG: hypothetical protein FJ304_14045 [Planctomycetes bacterium]|nr:hypothetical protein [Planctomycetota bacterium]
MWINRLALVAALAAVGCSKPAPPVGGGDDALTPEKARALIPDAAGVDAKTFEMLATDQAPTPDKLVEPRGQTLTWWVMAHEPRDIPKNPTSFKFTAEQINPSALANAISGPKDKDGKYRPVSTLIHPEYITDCTCKVEGEAAMGTVSFKVDKLYEGKIDYTARKKDGKWRIEEFRLPDYKVTLALGADGKWVKK